MKKPLVLVASALICPLILNADALPALPEYKSWFKGISNPTATNALGQSNGTWIIPASEVSVKDGALSFELEDDEPLAFNVTEGTAPDTNTITRVVVRGVFEQTATNNFPSESIMEARNAQVGFLVGIDDVSATNYYAWVGGSEWIKLASTAVEPDVVNEQTIMAEFYYNNTNATHPSVKFYVITENATNVLNEVGGQTDQFDVTSTAATTNRKVVGVSCYGSGSVSQIDGLVELGVAQVGTTKYGTLADAVNAAGTTTATIEILRDTDESVSLASGQTGITISDPGNHAKGTITIPENVSVKVETTVPQLYPATNGVYTIPLSTSGGTVIVELPPEVADYKEVATTDVANDKIEVTLQTRTDILAAVKPDETNGLMKNETKFRTFLDTYVHDTYTAADASATGLSSALNANGENAIPLWQSYVLGIAPNTSVAPVTAPNGDTASDGITLAIPAVSTNEYSGDYTVTYQAVGNNGVESGIASDNPQTIKIPLTTGTYTIKATFTPNSSNN